MKITLLGTGTPAPSLIRQSSGYLIDVAGDVLVWDHIGTLHNAIADYGPDEHRLMKRCQVMADRVFDPAFLRAALSQTTAA